jgi:hypothetical protein
MFQANYRLGRGTGRVGADVHDITGLRLLSRDGAFDTLIEKAW